MDFCDGYCARSYCCSHIIDINCQRRRMQEDRTLRESISRFAEKGERSSVQQVVPVYQMDPSGGTGNQ